MSPHLPRTDTSMTLVWHPTVYWHWGAASSNSPQSCIHICYTQHQRHLHILHQHCLQKWQQTTIITMTAHLYLHSVCSYTPYNITVFSLINYKQCSFASSPWWACQFFTVAAEELDGIKRVLWVNRSWNDNTIGIKESEHIPFSLVASWEEHYIKHIPHQCYDKWPSSRLAKHL